MSAAELEAAFPIEDACCAYFVERRWPDGVTCPRCGSHHVGRLKSAKWKWRCSTCGKGGAYHFSHIAGTVLENTKLPLKNWFRLVHLKLSSKEEVDTAQVQQRLGFSYKTAWTMCHRVDAVMTDSSFRKVVGFPAAASMPADGGSQRPSAQLAALRNRRKIRRAAKHPVAAIK
jgi:transposase-like protein